MTQTKRPGYYRRAISIHVAERAIRVAMEDDIHSFALILGHDGEMLRSISVDSIRAPWSTCPAASVALERLVGTPLTYPLPFASEAERYANCTHMLDLANVAVGRARQPGFARLYRIEIDPGDGEMEARLMIDGVPTLEWRIRDGAIVAGPFAGERPKSLLRVMAGRPLDEAEPILILRRAAHIGAARHYDHDGVESAAGLGSIAPTCHSLLPEIRPQAKRTGAKYVDFWADGRWPLEVAADN